MASPAALVKAPLQRDVDVGSMGGTSCARSLARQRADALQCSSDLRESETALGSGRIYNGTVPLRRKRTAALLRPQE